MTETQTAKKTELSIPKLTPDTFKQQSAFQQVRFIVLKVNAGLFVYEIPKLFEGV